MDTKLPDLITNDTVINQKTSLDISLIKFMLFKMKYEDLTESDYNKLLVLLCIDPTKYSFYVQTEK